MTRRPLLAAALAAVALLAAPPPQAGASPRSGAAAVASEGDVKAALLVNFLRFVEWPDETLRDSAPFTIASACDEPIGDALRAAARRAIVRGRRVAVVSPATDRDLERSDIAFVAAECEQPDADRLAHLASRHVLVVGEAPGILESGGALRLVVQEERVRFQATAGAATRTGLRISSALLDLATIVPAAAEAAARPAGSAP